MLVIAYAVSIPASFNWCEGQSCTPVENQYAHSYCGSCWAVATVGALSDRLKPILRAKNLPQAVLSIQDAMDCGQHYGYGDGCAGGEAWEVYQFVLEHGIVDASCNSYQARDLDCNPWARCRTCAPPRCKPVPLYTRYRIMAFDGVKGEKNMMKEIFQRGPIVCGIALSDAFWNYREGVFVEPRSHPLDHDIEVVGWGHETLPHRGPVDYWIVKNSFGSFWGENGYGRIHRGVNSSLVHSKCIFPIVNSSSAVESISDTSNNVEIHSVALANSIAWWQIILILILFVVGIFCAYKYMKKV